MADKKLIATTVSSREKGIRRREEGETTSSQRKISAQGNQDECKKNHTKPEDESPTQRGNRKNDMEDMRSKGGGRLKHCTVDGDVPLCLRRKLEDNKESSSSESKKYEEKGSGSGNQEKMKNCVMNNMASGCKELQLQYTAGKDMHSKNREVTFIILQKNMGSMLDPKGDKISCPAFGLYSSPAENSTMEHIVLDVTNLAYQPTTWSREQCGHPKRHVTFAMTERH